MGLFDSLFGTDQPSYEEQMAIYEAQVAQDKRNQEMGDITAGLDAVAPFMDVSRQSMTNPILQNQLDAQKALAGTRNYGEQGITQYLDSQKGRRDLLGRQQAHQYKVDNPLASDSNKKLEYTRWYMGLSPEDQIIADQANRGPDYLNLGTQYKRADTGEAFPIDVSGTAREKITGGSIGDRLVGYKQKRASNEKFITELDTHISSLDYLDENATDRTTGYGALTAFMPDDPSREYANKLEAVNAQTVIDTMTQLKSLSPTGSTGFGAVNIRELQVMMNKWGVIDQFMGKDQVKKIVNERKKIMNHIKSVSTKAQKQEEAWYERNKGSLPPEARELTPAGDLGSTKNKWGLD